METVLRWRGGWCIARGVRLAGGRVGLVRLRLLRRWQIMRCQQWLAWRRAGRRLRYRRLPVQQSWRGWVRSRQTSFEKPFGGLRSGLIGLGGGVFFSNYVTSEFYCFFFSI